MRLSIITPCSRPYNLPIIQESIIYNSSIFSDGIEWIIIYDEEKINKPDERILLYKSDLIDIKIGYYKKKFNEPYAAFIRNEGLKYVTGDYIYYLDDDNIIHKNLYDGINTYAERDKILIFNQFDRTITKARFMSVFNIKNIKTGGIDTAQFIIPKKYKHINWVNQGKYNDETPYLKEIIKESGEDKIKWKNLLYSYRNFLRRDTVN